MAHFHIKRSSERGEEWGGGADNAVNVVSGVTFQTWGTLPASLHLPSRARQKGPPAAVTGHG